MPAHSEGCQQSWARALGSKSLWVLLCTSCAKQAIPLLLHCPCCKDGKPVLSPSVQTLNLKNENRNVSSCFWRWLGRGGHTDVYMLKRCSSCSCWGQCVPVQSGLSSAIHVLFLVAGKPFHHLYLIHKGVTGWGFGGWQGGGLKIVVLFYLKPFVSWKPVNSAGWKTWFEHLLRLAVVYEGADR